MFKAAYSISLRADAGVVGSFVYSLVQVRCGFAFFVFLDNEIVTPRKMLLLMCIVVSFWLTQQTAQCNPNGKCTRKEARTTRSAAQICGSLAGRLEDGEGDAVLAFL